MDILCNNLHKHMNKLCLDIGSKHCGSPELDKAGQYIAEVFADEGYEVRKEEYPVRGWDYRSFSLYNVTQKCEVPAACACYFSNYVDIYDTPVWITNNEINKLEELDIKGRLCFVASWNLGGNVFGYNALAEKLDSLGVAAAIFLNRGGHTQLAPSSKIERSPFLKNMGAVAIAEQGAIFMANHKTDTYHLKIDANCYDTTAYNVIARIGRGAKKGVIGAHYDTAPLTQGAQDDTGGVAIMLEMARMMKNHLEDYMDEWTIDFAAFSAEEYIPHILPPGSGDYVERHKDEDIRWFLNVDDVAPHFAYHEVAISNIEKLPDIRYPYEVVKAPLSGDDKSFHSIGVPTIWINAVKLYRELHTAMDNLEHTDFDCMCKMTNEYNELLKQLL